MFSLVSLIVFVGSDSRERGDLTSPTQSLKRRDKAPKSTTRQTKWKNTHHIQPKSDHGRPLPAYEEIYTNSNSN